MEDFSVSAKFRCSHTVRHSWPSLWAARLLRRHGGPALLSFLPVVGDALVALAGATGLPPRAFLFWVTLGKGLRYAALAWAISSSL